MKDYIAGVGAANIDISGRSFQPIIMRDSNPGRMHISAGGVTRNILENAARLGARPFLLSLVGKDAYGRHILEHSSAAGIDVSHVRILNDHGSSSYLNILGADGDMVLALSDMDIMKEMDVSYLQENEGLLKGAKLIVTDPSIPPEVMDGLLQVYGKEVPVYLDPVSCAYAEVIKEKIGSFHTIKPNVLETEILSGKTIRSEKDLEEAAGILLQKGVSRVFVSRGAKGCYYADREGRKLCSALRPAEAVNATGAGDAFLAAVICATLQGLPPEEILLRANAAGIAAILSPDTINPEISDTMVEEIIKERNTCPMKSICQ